MSTSLCKRDESFVMRVCRHDLWGHPLIAVTTGRSREPWSKARWAAVMLLSYTFCYWEDASPTLRCMLCTATTVVAHDCCVLCGCCWCLALAVSVMLQWAFCTACGESANSCVGPHGLAAEDIHGAKPKVASEEASETSGSVCGLASETKSAAANCNAAA